MHFFVGKKPITEKFTNCLASHNLPTSSSHTKWCSVLLPIGDDRHDAVVTNKNATHINRVLTDVIILRTRIYKAEFLKILHSCQLNDKKGFDHVKGPHFLKSFTSVAPTWKCTAPHRNLPLHHSGNDLVGASGTLRGTRLGRRDLLSEGSQPSQFTRKSSEKASGNDSNYDAVLVLAGGQHEGGGVPVWVERRLDKAVELQQSNSRSSNGLVCKIVCLGGGTPHRPPIVSSEGFVVHESSSCAEYLHSRGIQFSHVIKEWGSYDTIGNGFFSLTQHAIPRRWQKLAIVTSEFHMPRTKAIFEWIFGLQGAGIALQQQQGGFDGGISTGSQSQGFRLEFHSALDDGVFEESIIQARLKRESRSLENLKTLTQQIHTLEDFHEWFHTEHKAYNTQDQHMFGKEEKLDPALLSY